MDMLTKPVWETPVHGAPFAYVHGHLVFRLDDGTATVAEVTTRGPKHVGRVRSVAAAIGVSKRRDGTRCFDCGNVADAQVEGVFACGGHTALAFARFGD